ncbi:MAG: Gfo/Idh/MocA family oxidoreductase [Verrucomicrobiae bacterium]
MKKHKNPSDIRVGVIGYGGAFNMGRGHLKEMQQAGMTPVAVSEIDPERLKVASGDFPGIETYSSVAEMLRKSDVNLITIITPHNTHAKLGLQCLRAGRHVVCEKPLAITTAECDAMVAAAKKSGVVLSTYHNRHWDGWILRAVEQIKEKKVIGDIYRIEARMGSRSQPGDWWRTSRSISGGLLYDWGVHLLEYGLQLIDSEITEVSGYSQTGYWAGKTKWKKDTNEDEAEAVVRFRNGSWLKLHITSLDSNPKPGFLEITGTEGSYVIDGNGYSLHKKDGKNHTLEEGEHYPSAWEKFYGNIADHLTKGAKLVITPEWSRRPIHILDLAAQSAQKGRALPAKYH